MALYVLVRPDGSLVEDSTGTKTHDTWLSGLTCEMSSRRRSGSDLKTGDDWPSRCWRAALESFNIPAALAAELGTLMGYKVVKALVSVAPVTLEGVGPWEGVEE